MRGATLGVLVAALLALPAGSAADERPLVPAADAVRAEASGGGEPPRRIVSLNVCSDLLLLALVPRERVLSVSFLSRDPDYSPLAAEAARLPTNRGHAEEVLRLRPDLVVTGRHTTPQATAVLRRLGVPVLELDIVASVAEALAQIRLFGRQAGVETAAEAMATALEARLEALAPGPDAPRPLVAQFGANGFTGGSHTLPGDLIARMGLDNLADRVGIETWGTLGLEDLARGRPRLLLMDTGRGGAPALARNLLEHRAARRLAEQAATAHVPGRLWVCPGPWLAEAAERLSQARSRALRTGER